MLKATTISGAKAYQRSDSEDRCIEFRKWHRTLDKKLYATDVDLVEMRFINGQLIAVGTLEITRVDHNVTVNQKYLNAIISRYQKRDIQKKMACYLAKKLGVKAWIVLYREGVEEFWVYCLSEESQRWYHFDQRRFEQWLKGLENGLS